MAKAREETIPIEILLEIFEDDGINLLWKKPKTGRIKVGSVVGTVTRHGYRAVKLFKKPWFVHRILWAMRTCRWPSSDQEIDHIDGDRLNNSTDNLRVVTNLLNKRNAIRSPSNTGVVGYVLLDEYPNLFIVERRLSNGKRVSKSFKTITEAEEYKRSLAGFSNITKRRHVSRHRVAWSDPTTGKSRSKNFRLYTEAMEFMSKINEMLKDYGYSDRHLKARQ